MRAALIGLIAVVGIMVLVGIIGFAWMASNPMHVHLPAFGWQGHKTLLFAHKQQLYEVLLSAQRHDLAGDIELADEDYNYILKDKDFQTWPAKLRLLTRRLAETRPTARKKHYMDELICQERLLYWLPSSMPIKVYLPTKESAEGLSKTERAIAKECLDQWVAACPEKLSYKIVKKKEDADLVFSEKSDANALGLSGNNLGHTVPMAKDKFAWGVSTIDRVNVDILAPGKKTTDEQIRRVILHELGHALGLGHSCNANDIMYCSDRGDAEAVLSDRDKETIRAMYMSPNLEHEAKEIIEREAANNNKNAVMALGREILRSQPDTPEIRKQVFELSKKAANLGLDQAQIAVGYHYYTGNEVPRDVYAAIHYWNRAAKQDMPGAYQALASAYSTGSGVLPDYRKANRYFMQALRLDSRSACEQYADFLCYAFGDDESLRKAAILYRQSAEGYSASAMERLATMYARGEGVKKDPAEAAKWYQRALDSVQKIKPTNEMGYSLRGKLWSVLGKSKESVTDLSRAIELKPKTRGLHLVRASEYFTMGDLDKAAHDASVTIANEPADIDAHFLKSLIHLVKTEPEKCLEHVSTILERAPSPHQRRLYALLYGSVARRMLDDQNGEVSMLAEAREQIQPGNWPNPIISYLQGRIDADELLKQSKGEDQLTEAHTFIGLCNSVSGNRSGALQNFKWVKDCGDHRFYEYEVSLSMLGRLEKKTEPPQKIVAR